MAIPTPAQIRAERERRQAERERERVRQNAEAIRERCRTLSGFVREAWPVLEPAARYIHNWHVDAVCQHLEAITAGQINRLLINVPPGSMKSLLVSVMWQAWEWGPKGLRSLRYLTTAFNEDPVKRDTRKTRDLIQSEWFQALWPEVRLIRTAEMSFANGATGTREGVPFGSLTSQRGDRLIVDDPHSVKTAESEAERNATTRNFREGALNRLNDQERSAIVVVMQRLHEKDVAGTILKLGLGYEHLCLPMEFEPSRRCRTSIGFTDPRDSEGELLDPVRFGPDTVAKLKAGMGSYAYAGQYQQRPAPREGGMFKRAWFEIVGAAPANARRVRAWDFAGTEGDGDWTAGIRLSESGGIYYVEHVVRFQGGPLDVERTVKSTAQADGPNVPVSMPQDPGQAGKSQARRMVGLLAGHAARATPETGSKEVRAAALAAQAEAGNVKLIAGPWNEAFLDEVSMFPAGAHDDQVDAASRAFHALAEDAGVYDQSMAWV